MKLSSVEKQNMIRAFRCPTPLEMARLADEFKAALSAYGIEMMSGVYVPAFHLIDSDGSGYIDSKELNRFFMDFAPAGSDADFYDIIGRAADLNGDGIISINELKRFHDSKHEQMTAED